MRRNILIFILLALFWGCDSKAPPVNLEKACAPLKAQWTKEVRAKVEAEVRAKVEAERQAAAAAKPSAPVTTPPTPKPASPPVVVKPGRPGPPELVRAPGALKKAPVPADPPPAPVTPTVKKPDPTPATPKATPKPTAPPEGKAGRRGVTLWPRTPTKLADLAFATSVENRTPVGISTHYKTAPDTLFCFTSVSTTLEKTTVTHVWRQNERIVSRVVLNVRRSPTWRTWSRRATGKQPDGRWSCEVLDADGSRIGIAKTKVGR